MRQQAVPGTESALLQLQSRRARFEALEALWTAVKEKNQRGALYGQAFAELGDKGAETERMEYDRASEAFRRACEDLYALEDTEAPWTWL